MEETFKLSTLNEFLCRTLKFTEEVKNVLRSDCDEAMFSLKPWCVETNVRRETTENICTCSKTTSETEVEEIAAGISRALLQTQQLREKLSFNAVKSKKSVKQTGVSTVYNSALTSSSKSLAKKVPSLQKNSKLLKPTKICDKEKMKLKSLSVPSITAEIASEVTNSLAQKKSPKVSDKKSYLTSATERYNIKPQIAKKSPGQQFVVSNEKINLPSTSHNNNTKAESVNKISTKDGVNSTKGKDFLKLNKLSVKNTKQVDKNKGIDEKLKSNLKSNLARTEIKSVNLYKRCSAASTSELQNLIHKMSVESNESTLSSKEEKVNCPLHGNIPMEFLYEQNFLTMDAVEGLDRSGIPGEVLKTLKTYHMHLKSEFSNEPADKKIRSKMVNKFLTDFQNMNEKIHEQLKPDTDVMNLTKNFICLFPNIYHDDLKSTSLNEIKRADSELNFLRKMYDTKGFDVSQFKRSMTQDKLLYNITNTKGLMSNGIWNCSYITNFTGIFRAYCLRYISKDQLVSFFGTIQELQQMQYVKDLIDVILNDVVPDLKASFDPTNPEHIRAYKMICILCQGLNPKPPVLVKTDK